MSQSTVIRPDELQRRTDQFISDPVRHCFLNQLVYLHSQSIPRWLLKTNGEIEMLWDERTEKMINEVQHNLSDYELAKYPDLFISS